MSKTYVANCRKCGNVVQFNQKAENRLSRKRFFQEAVLRMMNEEGFNNPEWPYNVMHSAELITSAVFEEEGSDEQG